MPTIHVKDEFYGRYVNATRDSDKLHFNKFVNDVVEEAVEKLER